MSAHLQREIERLKKHVLLLSCRGGRSGADGPRGVSERDETLAAQVEHCDSDIDQREIEGGRGVHEGFGLAPTGGRRSAAITPR